MPKKQFLSRLVHLTRQDYYTIRRLAVEKGLGANFSAALRIIIREWSSLRTNIPPPPNLPPSSFPPQDAADSSSSDRL